MRVRIIVGIILLPVLPLVLFFAPDWTLAAVISLISALSVWELLGNTGFAPKKRLSACAVVFAACVPVWFYIRPCLGDYAGSLRLAGPLLFLMALFGEAVADHERVTFKHIGVIFTTAVCIPSFFSSLIRVMAFAGGKYVIMLPFIAALLGDTCAYFTGSAWGRHKLTPVSPKKTVEGSVGGLIGVLAGMVLYGVLMQTVFGRAVSYPLLLLYGLAGSLAGQLGDLSMSLVKREFQIKDFGSLLPGHGGVLDRFDSLLFAAPVLEVLIILLPAIEAVS
ncbi:MAG: phosphatidate cytidylyltransferase [Oscillospiraceae bacterium]|jgi:phosphatidate cytidylyltransferase|nr:phosphatidate cytidylyltransferase [Oscillospiraceae bacterium]